MPTYDYSCKLCSETFEIFHSISEAPKKMCPSCKKEGLERKISSGAGIIFKGSGFYETDYKKSPSTSSEPKESSTSKNCSTNCGCGN
ncbi:MAG: FmdB family transcriptional regulator [Verrucomicrobia bacterium CG_4_10_14_3_um_filter_43_23]|nr:MAG: FmdB family transcriptional regulator [Verrucomicrobia bacterium CG1_02_43_26]PIP58540.1 MAG: FmdB family transcriptional regulator [Verrucomicrobia bacterium CG22_combo_CG10-13_8_21_14_all_43_17]PIX58338.1 MAG: FmdB family transcriptional regulator [Verrucomicrobia bacterium CG_4_10_14_3_um_filter_43_23]PIY60865.1 MAG: FmdB family transcriptional regulator [Verrucomicrobia bacterium CG_4_10_14_0_8_um_filter_43_34]PJA44355.1 MAG: FmdB family transcriptional regulator [Verrucomicrobia ba